VSTVYSVPDMSCQHCVNTLTTEVGAVPGVEGVDIDLASKTVTVHWQVEDDAAVRSAIEEAGYEIAVAGT
jgi:copper chaperone